MSWMDDCGPAPVLMRVAMAAWLTAGGIAHAQAPADPAPEPTEEPASPSREDTKARELYELGASLYDGGRYELAIEAFREAHSLSGYPDLLFNIANAQERLGDLPGAIASLEAFRPDAPPEDWASIDGRIATLRNRVATAEAAAAAAAVPPPAAPEPTPLPPPLPVEDDRRRPRWGLVIAGSGAAAVFGTVAAFTFGSRPTLVEQGLREQYTRVRTINNTSLVAAGIGALTATAGIVFTVPVKAANTASTVHVTPTHVTMRF